MTTPDAPDEPVLRDLGWGLREVLHWLVGRVSGPLPADAPTAAEVHAAVDAAYPPAAEPAPEPPSLPVSLAEPEAPAPYAGT